MLENGDDGAICPPMAYRSTFGMTGRVESAIRWARQDAKRAIVASRQRMGSVGRFSPLGRESPAASVSWERRDREKHRDLSGCQVRRRN